MELPFLKNKQKFDGGGGVSEPKRRVSDKTDPARLLSLVADEMLAALLTRDRKAFREALQALVLAIKDEDEAPNGV